MTDDPEQLAAIIESMPHAHALGVTLDEASPDVVRGQLAWTAELCTTGGLLHGGALMTFADSLGAVCAFLNLPPGAATTTVSSTTSFVRAVRGGRVSGVARPLHAGRTIIAVQTELRDDEDRLVAQTTQSQAVLPPRAG